MKLDTIRVFAISKLDWVKKQYKKLLDQERESEREFYNRESHCVWGNRYLMSVIDRDKPPSVLLKHSKMAIQARPGTLDLKQANACLSTSSNPTPSTTKQHVSP